MKRFLELDEYASNDLKYRLIDFIRANNLRPKDVPANQTVTIHDTGIELDLFVTDEQGQPVMDETLHRAQRERVTVPLLSDPKNFKLPVSKE